MVNSQASTQTKFLKTSNASAVAWSAVFAGAATTAALSLILLILGVGLGLSTVSPWAQSGVNAMTLGITTIIWLTATQVIAAGMGGYLAGRLRTRWDGVHNDEVYFRDTAHGFLSWGVATLVTVVLLTSTIGSILGATINAGASVASSTSTSTVNRVINSAAETANTANTAQNNTAFGTANVTDKVVAAKDTADKTRKASATAALWLFVSLLMGAFAASFAAIYGGRQRDKF
jgi:TctA family transporter